MKVKQLSVFLENKPGALSRPAELLAKARLNILTLSIADTQRFGILRFIVAEWEMAKALL
ncbi:MAG: ACT domain-containing protein, partial [Verrucomicrobiota bacterium]